MAPFLVIVLAFAVYPFVELIRLSFSDVRIVDGSFVSTFNGLDNAATALTDPEFGNSAVLTIVFTVASTALSVALGTLLAIAAYPAWLVMLALAP